VPPPLVIVILRPRVDRQRLRLHLAQLSRDVPGAPCTAPPHPAVDPEDERQGRALHRELAVRVGPNGGRPADPSQAARRAADADAGRRGAPVHDHRSRHVWPSAGGNRLC